jgi:hypothetical protein
MNFCATRKLFTRVSGSEMPAVDGSTTTMSLPVALGAPVREMQSSLTLGTATTTETVLEREPFGFFAVVR